MALAGAIILGQKQRPQIGAIEITANIREAHSRSADITQYPIETGGELSDHRRIHARELIIDGFISDAATTSQARIDDDGKVVREPGNLQGFTAQEAYQQLLDLFVAKDLFDVVTGLEVYQNMVFRRFEVVRERGKDAIVGFTAELVQVEFATAQTVEVTPPDAPKLGDKKDLGNKPTKPAADGPRKSTALRAAEWITKNPAAAFKGLLQRLPVGVPF